MVTWGQTWCWRGSWEFYILIHRQQKETMSLHGTCRPTERSLGHWGVLLKGIMGHTTASASVPTLLWLVNSLALPHTHNYPPWFSDLSQVQINRTSLFWMETNNKQLNKQQIKLFCLWANRFGGLNKNGPCRLISLNAQSPVGRTV